MAPTDAEHHAFEHWRPHQRALARGIGVLFGALLLSAPVLWLVARPARTVSNVPAPVWNRASVRSGEAMRVLERHLKEASWVTLLLRGWWNETQLSLGVLENPRVVVGRDDWLFLAETVRWDPDALARSQAGRRAVLAEADRLAQAAGIRLLVLPVPDKTTIYPEFLDAGRQLPEGRRQLYDTIVADLAAVGLPFVDVRQVFHAHRAAHPGELLYHARDTHWRLPAMQLLAAEVLRRATAEGWRDDLGTTSGLAIRPPLRAPFVPDLVNLLGLRNEAHGRDAHVSPFVRSLMEEAWSLPVHVPGPGGTSPPMAPEQPGALIALCGSSYSQEFAGPLAAAFGTVVDHRGVVPAGGSFRGLRKVVEAVAAGRMAPKVLLWEFVEREYLDEWTRVRSLLD